MRTAPTLFGAFALSALLLSAACTSSRKNAESGGTGGASGGTSAAAGSPGAGGNPTGGNPSAGAQGGVAQQAGAGQGGGASGTPYVYVSGSGASISIFTLDAMTGALTSRGTAPGGQSPTYLAISPDRRYLYAVNEISPSRVIAFSINPSTGALTEINRQNTDGNGAPHLAVHPSGRWLAVAHYGSGHITVLPVLDGGGVGPPSDTSRGPSDGCRMAHQAVFDRSGAHLFVPCLGSNYVIQFLFNQGILAYNDPQTVAVAGGPRHMALHPSERYAYVLSELGSTITSFAYDAAQGRLSAPETIPSVEQTVGSSAHIVVHPSGAFLYASNRTENSLGLFSIDGSTGRPSPVAFERSMVATPRDFTLDPAGQFLISANQGGSQNLLVFRIAAADGRLTRVQTVAVGGGPSFVGVVALP